MYAHVELHLTLSPSSNHPSYRLCCSLDGNLVLASIGGTGIGWELLERVDLAASELAPAAEGRLEVVLVCTLPFSVLFNELRCCG